MKSKNGQKNTKTQNINSNSLTSRKVNSNVQPGVSTELSTVVIDQNFGNEFKPEKIKGSLVTSKRGNSNELTNIQPKSQNVSPYSLQGALKSKNGQKNTKTQNINLNSSTSRKVKPIDSVNVKPQIKFESNSLDPNLHSNASDFVRRTSKSKRRTNSFRPTSMGSLKNTSTKTATNKKEEEQTNIWKKLGRKMKEKMKTEKEKWKENFNRNINNSENVIIDF